MAIRHAPDSPSERVRRQESSRSRIPVQGRAIHGWSCVGVPATTELFASAWKGQSRRPAPESGLPATDVVPHIPHWPGSGSRHSPLPRFSEQAARRSDDSLGWPLPPDRLGLPAWHVDLSSRAMAQSSKRLREWSRARSIREAGGFHGKAEAQHAVAPGRNPNLRLLSLTETRRLGSRTQAAACRTFDERT